MEVKNKVCVVTGGSSGLGRGTLNVLRRAGARVVNFDMAPIRGGPDDKDLLFAKVDVTDEAAVATGFDQVMQRFGAVDVCVNCAGVVKGAPLLGDDGTFPLALFRQIIEVNLTGTFIVAAAAARLMAKNQPGADGERGVIVNTSSIAAMDASSSVAYAASKGGVASMTLTAARDLARYGIRVNAIAPGFMDTAMFSGLPPGWTEKLIAKTVFPNRLGHSEEFGELVLYLVESRFMNASVIRFDAGSRV